MFPEQIIDFYTNQNKIAICIFTVKPKKLKAEKSEPSY